MALFDPNRFDTLKKMAKVLLDSHFLPNAIKSESQVIAIIIKGYELGVPPMESLSAITVMDGKPAASPQLMLALINRSGQLQDLLVEGSEKKCTVTMTRRGRRPHTEVFSIEDAGRMKSRDRDGNVISLNEKYNWRQMPAVMLRWRAVAACARVVFPDVIGGLYTPDEMGADVVIDEDGAMQVVDPRPAENARDQHDSGRPQANGEVDDRAAQGVRAASAGPETTGAARPATGAPASQPTGHDEARGPATTAQPLTAEERQQFKALITEAARAEGVTSETPGQDWLERHYGARSLDEVVSRLDDIAQRANAAITSQKHPVSGGVAADSGASTTASASTTTPAPDETRGPEGTAAPATSTKQTPNSETVESPARMPAAEFRALIHKAAVIQHVKSKTPGKAWLLEHYHTDDLAGLTDEQYEDAVSNARRALDEAMRTPGQPGRPQMATTASITALNKAFERLQFTDHMRAGFVSAATDERAQRPEDMTEIEIRALIDELGESVPQAPAKTATPTPPTAA